MNKTELGMAYRQLDKAETLICKLEAELATLKAELAALKETKEACGVLASITKTFGGMRDNASYEAEIAELKAEKEKADQIIKDLSSDRMLYKDMAERAEASLKMCVWLLVKQGNMTRMRAAQIVGINIADMDDFMKEQDKTALARLEEIENELKQAVEGK